ncbi:MAG: hypothetical protein K0S25_1794, partial [Bacillus sp. (in: firmicutes)]|nr:hypothetical protein [Bacillus sp. (in: firmicutes)]
TGETHRRLSAEEAHRPPGGKQAPGAEINHLTNSNNVYENSQKITVNLADLYLQIHPKLFC